MWPSHGLSLLSRSIPIPTGCRGVHQRASSPSTEARDTPRPGCPCLHGRIAGAAKKSLRGCGWVACLGNSRLVLRLFDRQACGAPSRVAALIVLILSHSTTLGRIRWLQEIIPTQRLASPCHSRHTSSEPSQRQNGEALLPRPRGRHWGPETPKGSPRGANFGGHLCQQAAPAAARLHPGSSPRETRCVARER